MPSRIFNFFPGPCTLPLSVLEKARDEFVNYQDSGMSLWETSHRTPAYEEIHNAAKDLMHEVFQIPDTHDILMISGGGTLQFAMIPMNFLTAGKFAQHVITGWWAKRALDDARSVGDARVIASSEDVNYKYVPKDFKVDPKAEYLYVTTNNTIVGSELHEYPETGDIPIIADMSSDILTRPVPWDRIGLSFAGLTKNLGPGGMAVVIARKDMIEKSNKSLPTYLRYDIHSEHNSMFNTPAMFCIYIMKGILEWTKEQGGLEAMDRKADWRANKIYGVIDKYPEYYQCLVDKQDRSRTNLCFRLPTKEMDKKFSIEALAENMSGLAGYFQYGFCRASLYNAMPDEGVEKLEQFMIDFMERNPA